MSKTATKKKVTESKTKETYKSKAAMMKHEKGESKAMKKKEGEIFQDGGKKIPTKAVSRTGYKVSAKAKAVPSFLKESGMHGVTTKPKPTVKKPQFTTNIKPTADSTAYYGQKREYYKKASEALSKEGKQLLSMEAKGRANKAADDMFRQRKKAKPGYDKNGFPLKELPEFKKGGKMSCNCGGKGCMKCGGTKEYKNGGKKKADKKKVAPVKGAWVPPWVKASAKKAKK